MRILTALILAFVLVSLAIPALAQAQCGSHDEVATSLAQEFFVAVVAQGLASDGRLTQIWANPETGSWTVTTTLPSGLTCLQDAGEQFRAAKPGEPA